MCESSSSIFATDCIPKDTKIADLEAELRRLNDEILNDEFPKDAHTVVWCIRRILKGPAFRADPLSTRGPEKNGTFFLSTRGATFWR